MEEHTGRKPEGAVLLHELGSVKESAKNDVYLRRGKLFFKSTKDNVIKSQSQTPHSSSSSSSPEHS